MPGPSSDVDHPEQSRRFVAPAKRVDYVLSADERRVVDAIANARPADVDSAGSDYAAGFPWNGVG